MRKTRLRITFMLAAMVGLWSASQQEAHAQANDILWNGADLATWSTGSNWDGGFVPLADFNDQAIVDNNTTVVVESENVGIDLFVEPAATGNVILGQTNGNMGGLEIRNGGILQAADDTHITFAEPNVVGQVSVGTGGEGVLTVLGGGELIANNLTSGGADTSRIILDGSGAGMSTVNVASAALDRTLRVIGPNVAFTADGALNLRGTVVAEITGTTHGLLAANAAARAEGTLAVEFNGHTPQLGDSWTIVDAPTILGTFDAVDASAAPALGAAQAYGVHRVPGGRGQQLRLSVDQLLTLQVNWDTGGVAIMNEGPNEAAAEVSVSGYTISSGFGSLGGSWNSLADQGNPNWSESPNSDANGLTELNSAGELAVAGGASQSLGTPFSAMFPAFGVDPEDVSFEYTTALGRQAGLVEYVGTKRNNTLILTVDDEGNAQLKNDSPFDVDIDGYSIFSESDSMLPDSWVSLADAGETGWEEAAPTTSVLSELNPPEDPFTVGANATFDLGTIAAAGVQDLSFEFLRLGDADSMPGVVIYGDAPPQGLPGDFNGDGAVDATDVGIWETNFGSAATSATGDANNDGFADGNDYMIVQRNFTGPLATAAGAAVPEPATFGMLMVSSIAVLLRRRRDLAHRLWRCNMGLVPVPARVIVSRAMLAVVAALAAPALSQAANVMYLTPDQGDDEPMIDIIKRGGHRIVSIGDFAAAPPTSEELADVDVIVMSRGVGSGNYIQDMEPAEWNALEVPLVQFQMYLARPNIRWGWFNTETMVGEAFTPSDFEPFPNASHPFVNGLTTNVYPYAQTTDYIDIVDSQLFPPGATTIATMNYEGISVPAIVDIPAGTTLFPDAQDVVTVTGERRVLFQIHEYVDGSSPSQDLLTITENGAAIVNQIIEVLGGPADSLIGDVNDDGAVNTLDYDVILSNFGGTGNLGDGDLTGDGLIDLDDFHAWRLAESAAVASNASIPEPATIVIAAFGLAALGLQSARRRRRGATVNS